VKRRIRIKYYKSSGPGGQRRNKKRTAVKALDLASGISAVAQETPSQALNRKIAIARLKTKLERLKRKKKARIPTKLPDSVKKKIKKAKQIRSEKKKLRAKLPVSIYTDYDYE